MSSSAYRKDLAKCCPKEDDQDIPNTGIQNFVTQGSVEGIQTVQLGEEKPQENMIIFLKY